MGIQAAIMTCARNDTGGFNASFGVMGIQAFRSLKYNQIPDEFQCLIRRDGYSSQSMYHDVYKAIRVSMPHSA